MNSIDKNIIVQTLNISRNYTSEESKRKVQYICDICKLPYLTGNTIMISRLHICKNHSFSILCNECGK